MSGEDVLARMEALVAGLERAARESEQELAASGAQRAADAREGRLGPDWQAVQRRIDAGQTSLRDVFSGRDETPEARRLVQVSQQNLAELAAQGPPEEMAGEVAVDLTADLAAVEEQWNRWHRRPQTGPQTDQADQADQADPTDPTDPQEGDA